MKFLLRQKILSFSDTFNIKDENEITHYLVKGRVFSLGDKLRFCDKNENELFFIEQKLFKLLPEYYIWEKEKIIAHVKKEFTFFKPKFNIESSLGSFKIDGDFLGHDFSIYKNGIEVVQIYKKWLSFSDTYEVNVLDEKNQAFLLALVIVIDQVIHDSNKNNN